MVAVLSVALVRHCILIGCQERMHVHERGKLAEGSLLKLAGSSRLAMAMVMVGGHHVVPLGRRSAVIVL